MAVYTVYIKYNEFFLIYIYIHTHTLFSLWHVWMLWECHPDVYLLVSVSYLLSLCITDSFTCHLSVLESHGFEGWQQHESNLRWTSLELFLQHTVHTYICVKEQYHCHKLLVYLKMYLRHHINPCKIPLYY